MESVVIHTKCDDGRLVMNMLEEDDPVIKDGIRFFRHQEGTMLDVERESDPMSSGEGSQVINDGLNLLADSGMTEGISSRILFDVPNFSLAKLSLKSNFPLPLHVHNVDCLYYILAGSLRVGREELGAGDGFFVPAEIPYTFSAGFEGSEILEIRKVSIGSVTTRFTSKSQRYWKKIAQIIAENRQIWLDQQQ